MTPRLIVMSNRVNVPTARDEGAAGGLAMALTSALREYKGIWFGWSGQTSERFTGQVQLDRINGVTSATVDLQTDDYEEYYAGYANRTLWPLFHYRVDLVDYDRDFDTGYRRVNRRLARTVDPFIEPDDLIWVHDYHMIPIAAELKALGRRNAMGFFLHVPWPPRQLFVTLPNHRQLAEALFAYDLIGFQTHEWLEAFIDYVVHDAGAVLGENGTITCFGRTVRAAAYPIGIDAQEFTAMAESEAGRTAHDMLVSSARDRKLIIGADRLDYSKGIEARFAAYEALLEAHEDLHRQVVCVQIAPPSREDVNTYQRIRETLDSLAGRINGRFSDVDWTPMRYVNRGYSRQALAGFFRASRVGLVTPLRDGMNLVAKEYVAAQDPEDPGVLILSRFAGASEQLGDALLVNPFSTDDLADAMQRALTMPLAERKRRNSAMRAVIDRENVAWWRDRFVTDLTALRDATHA
ncbi:MAG: trehalose-6-phosphate synthase [Pararhodobacter sp.]|nr:trehalose-6-phosphate synthase [Pararhodobacter sp.]